ncbi:cysteine-rich secretory protein family protein [Sarocladium implicatum]|nr:cysteine-rich secretory protein family protein [Sarocladium implicatum]
MRFTSLMLMAIAALGVHSAALPEPDQTLSSRQSATSSNPKWTDDTDFYTSIVKRHNQYRGEHRVKGLTWSKTLSGYAKKYMNKKGTGKHTCPDFAHSGGSYGENLAIGYSTPTQATIAWGDERKDYNFKKPGYKSGTGHFTQMVWKDTKQLGCARKYCTSSNVLEGWYLACEYYPRGNVIGQFDKQVLPQKSKRDAEDAGHEDEDELVDDDDFDFAEDAWEDDGEGYVGEPLVFYAGR